MKNNETELTTVKSNLSSIGKRGFPTHSENLGKPFRNPSNLSKYLILRELSTLEEGVPSSVLAEPLGMNPKRVSDLLGNYRKWDLVAVVGTIKRREGGRPFFLWMITDKGRERFNWFHDKIMQGQNISHRRR